MRKPTVWAYAEPMTTTTVWTSTQRRTPVRNAMTDLAALAYHYHRMATTVLLGRNPR